MATRTAKLNFEISGERDYKQAIADMNRENRALSAEMKKLAEQYKGSEDSMEAMRAKSDLLQRQLDQQKEKVKTLRDALERAKTEYGEADKRTDSWRIQLLNAERDEIKLQRALRDTNDAIEEEGKASDHAADALSELGSSTEDASKKTSVFAGVLKADLVHDAINLAIDGLKKAGEMAIDFGKKVIESYGELEQNLGGSEAVFGEYAETVQRAAEQSYKTLGASESEYLAAANKMGALFQGSGVEVQRSMELTTQAIQRAADVASVMGVDTTAAMEAVTGAAKGNYTMMDNLGVKMDATTLKAYALSEGMAKTWEEMSNAEKAELAMKYFFEQTEKYAGNFEEEARTTISGSIGMLQASVESWVAGLGNAEADIGTLTGNVIDSFETVVKNVVPIVENVIQSMPEIYDSVMSAVKERSPELAERLKNFMDPLGDILSSLWNIAQSLWPVLEPVLKGMAWGFEKVAEFIAWGADRINDLVNGILSIPEDWMNRRQDSIYDPSSAAYNAAGDTNWRGGLTWVGEQGPELVSLPQGSRIYSNPESERIAAAGTDTSRMEALLERSVAIMQRISDDLDDLEAVRRMA